MKNRTPLFASVLCSLLLSGCAAAAGTMEPADGRTPHTPVGVASAPAAAHAGHHESPAAASTATAATGPSEAALMVCGSEPMERLTAILHLTHNPHTINSWANSTFTCTYHLDQGALKIAVQDAATPAAARTYFDAMRALAAGAKPITGLASLGFPAYETPEGAAVFQKDSFILTVDATELPESNGPDAITRNALAYQLSTTILACWVEHH